MKYDFFLLKANYSTCTPDPIFPFHNFFSSSLQLLKIKTCPKISYLEIKQNYIPWPHITLLFILVIVNISGPLLSKCLEPCWTPIPFLQSLCKLIDRERSMWLFPILPHFQSSLIMLKTLPLQRLKPLRTSMIPNPNAIFFHSYLFAPSLKPILHRAAKIQRYLALQWLTALR